MLMILNGIINRSSLKFVWHSYSNFMSHIYEMPLTCSHTDTLHNFALLNDCKPFSCMTIAQESSSIVWQKPKNINSSNNNPHLQTLYHFMHHLILWWKHWIEKLCFTVCQLDKSENCTFFRLFMRRAVHRNMKKTE